MTLSYLPMSRISKNFNLFINKTLLHNALLNSTNYFNLIHSQYAQFPRTLKSITFSLIQNYLKQDPKGMFLVLFP